MEFFQQLDQTSGVNYISNNNMKLVHNKKRLTEEQVGVLERSFRTNKKLEPELKHHLANKLGVPPRQVAIWYQNKRARWKTQNLEVGYNALQLQLQTVTADKKRLERQLKHLQEELQKAQDMLFTLTTSNHHQEGGGRFDHGDSSSHELLVDDGNDELFHLCMFDFCK